MVIVSVDKNKAVRGCENVDPIIALAYLELFAQSLGLGTLWDDFATIMLQNSPKAYEMLAIPENYTLNFVLLLGEPAVNHKRTPQKAPANVNLLS